MTKNGLQTQVKDRKPQPLTAVWRNGGGRSSYKNLC